MINQKDVASSNLLFIPQCFILLSAPNINKCVGGVGGGMGVAGQISLRQIFVLAYPSKVTE
jgi:hypothetical protein